MSEEDLIKLVKQIRISSGCMMDLDGLLGKFEANVKDCLLYTSPSPRDQRGSRMPSSA